MTEEGLCRWCGGRMISSPDGGHGIVCERCWWPSSECRCPIRRELVTKDTPRPYTEFAACGFSWEGDHGHACGRPSEHQGHHACGECGGMISNPESYLSV